MRRQPQSKAALLWNLEFGSSIEFLEAVQKKGQAVPALDRQPDLESDLNRLLQNFDALCQTREQAFEGIANLRLQDIISLYQAEEWWLGAISLGEYIGLMLALDRALKKYYKEHKPIKTTPQSREHG